MTNRSPLFTAFKYALLLLGLCSALKTFQVFDQLVEVENVEKLSLLQAFTKAFTTFLKDCSKKLIGQEDTTMPEEEEVYEQGEYILNEPMRTSVNFFIRTVGSTFLTTLLYVWYAKKIETFLLYCIRLYRFIISKFRW